MSVSRALRRGHPRVTNRSETRPAAMLVTPRAKNGIQVSAPKAEPPLAKLTASPRRSGGIHSTAPLVAAGKQALFRKRRRLVHCDVAEGRLSSSFTGPSRPEVNSPR
jgi:hypothetical protein